jgi:hypothetical protein
MVSAPGCVLRWGNYVPRKDGLQALFVARYHRGMKTKQQPPPVKRPRGRPPVNEGEETVTMNVRMSVSQRAKVERNGGGVWVRALIDKAKD